MLASPKVARVHHHVLKEENIRHQRVDCPFDKRERVKTIWRQCDAVCFDVDSTVIAEEGIDELAAFLGKEEEVSALTIQAMGGNMTFRDALEKRLNILKPSRNIMTEFANQGKLKLTPGIKELVHFLHSLKVDVYLVSGGFKLLIFPTAQQLNIPLENVYANELLFTEDGSYAGFNKENPTSASGGKGKVAAHLKNAMGYKNMVFIGDGATDLEACPPADAFIGFGGNVVREKVKAESHWYVYSFQELMDEYTSL